MSQYNNSRLQYQKSIVNCYFMYALALTVNELNFIVKCYRKRKKMNNGKRLVDNISKQK